MAKLLNERAEQQQLNEKQNVPKTLHDEFAETDAVELSDDELDQATGGISGLKTEFPRTGLL